MRNEWDNQVKTNGIRMLLVKIKDGKFYIFSIFFSLFFLSSFILETRVRV